MKKRVFKGGRPRTDRPAIDLGSPELLMKRASLAGPPIKEIVDGKEVTFLPDPAMTTCPIDILLTKRLISPEAYSAAVHFRACWLMIFGSPHAKAIDLTHVTGPERLGDIERATEAYRGACETLRKFSVQHLDAVENLVIHERTPPWMRVTGGPHSHHRKRFMEGLACLLGWHQGKARAA